jgi:hypothetical protein
MEISVKCIGVDNYLLSQTVLYNRRWNYNGTFYYYYLKMEKIYKINKSNILHSKFSISAKFMDVSCNCKQQLSQNCKMGKLIN